MRRTLMIVLAGMLSAAIASSAAAQQEPPARAERMQARQPMARLFQGIALTANQQERVTEILEAHRAAVGAPAMGRGRFRGDSADARRPRRPLPDSAGERRPVRERPDSATMAALRAEREERMAEMQEQRVAVIAELRSVLRDDQLQTFDANVAALEKAQENRPRRGRGGRIDRDAHRS
jgi:hypothetical protein